MRTRMLGTLRPLILLIGSSICAIAMGYAQVPLRLHIDVSPLFNLSIAEGANFEQTMKTKTYFGYRFGVGADINIAHSLYVGVGANFLMKQDHLNLRVPEVSIDYESIKSTSHYVQVPVHIGYSATLTPAIRLSVETGPYFAYALGTTYSTGSLFKDSKETLDTFKEGVSKVLGDRMRNYEIGIDAQIRLAFGNYYGLAGADFGLLNRLKSNKEQSAITPIKQDALRNISFFLGAGYSF